MTNQPMAYEAMTCDAMASYATSKHTGTYGVMNYDAVVVGAGAAGLLAAGLLRREGHSILLLDKNARPGRKLLLTGKGRCNLTNACGVPELAAAVPRGGKFLYSAFTAFPPERAMAFFESIGVPVKVERGNRVFPASDRAMDVVDALSRFAGRHTRAAVESVQRDGEQLTIQADSQLIRAKAVLIATGGLSYPATGSTGDGYTFARQLGHTVEPPRPSLVPIVAEGGLCVAMAGLSLKNIRLTLTRDGRVLFSEQGELLFTHFGISGPLTLSASAHMGRDVRGCQIALDLKPALSREQLDARLLREFGASPNKAAGNVLRGLPPHSMIPAVADLCGIPLDLPVHSVTKAARTRLCALLKAFPLSPSGFRPVEEAVITAGGVRLSEVDPKTMESKLVPGLFFAGEVLDADGYTGGYNLQIAWATAHAAARGIARKAGRAGLL